MADVRIECKLSTDLNAMADLLARRLRTPQGRPFQKEIILVNGKAMSNWLTHYLVCEADLGGGLRGLGIHANADLMNTQRFHTWAAGVIDPLGPKSDPLEGLELVIDRHLRQEPGEFGQFCGDEAKDGGLVRWGVSQRLASWLRELSLDDPDWMMRTEQGALKGRLEDLWRKLRKELKGQTAADVTTLLCGDPQASKHRAALASALPGRIFLFATGDLPRTLLQSLTALQQAGVCVEGFFLQPSERFHLDLLEEIKAELKLSKAPLQAYMAPDEYTLPQGLLQDHPGANILSSAAPYFRSQFRKVLNVDGWDLSAPEPSEAGENQPITLLDRLKDTINRFDEDPATMEADEPQESVSIHRCHGPTREAEVLRDQLLAACQADPSLRARDILILTPDPDTYGAILPPILSAARIRTVTVGIEGIHQSPASDLAKRLLTLPAGRCTAPEVLELCEPEAVCTRFGWDTADVERIARWLEQSPFYWGSSGKQRARRGLPESSSQWTLADLEKRLILGTALPKGSGPAGQPVTLPFLGLDGKNDTQLAAELIEFIRTIRTWCDDAQDRRPLGAWISLFSETVKALLPTEFSFRESAAAMLGALGRMEAVATQGDDAEVPLSLFTSFAQEYLDFDFAKGQFLNGNAVLAPLKAGHVHPAKIIAFIGMGDGAFPSRGLNPGPELNTNKAATARKYREQKEEAGMHSFLLALCAARSRVICTYPGYAAGGKDASAALPIEILRRACRQIHTGFKEHRHGLFAHEGSQTTDPASRAVTIDNETTFDPVAAEVAGALADKRKQLKPGPDLGFDPSKLGLEPWIEFWTNPTRGVLGALNVDAPYLKGELPSDEVLDDPTSHGSYAAANWIKNYVQVTGQLPNWDTAKLSGHFDTRDSGKDFFDEKIEDAPQPEDAGDAENLIEWNEVIQELFEGAPRGPVSLRTKHFKGAFVSKEWLAFCTDDKLSSNGELFILALAAAAFLARRDKLKIKGLVLLERDGPANEENKRKAGTAQALQFEDPAQVLNGLQELAQKAVKDNYALGPKATDKLAWNAVSGKFDQVLPRDTVMGGFKSGDLDNNHVSLVAPENYSLEDASKAFLDSFKELGVKKLLKPELKTLLIPPVATSTKKSKGKTSA